MGPNEPYWRTNSSFSPPLSRRWDNRSQSEALPYGLHGSVQLYGSSLSSNSKGSRSWVRGEQLLNHQNSASDGVASYFSSPSDSFQTQQWTPPSMQGVSIDDYVSATMIEPMSVPSAFLQSTEGTSAIPYSTGSTSSHSDASEYETMVKTPVPSHRNFSSRCSFMSKPVYPLSYLNQSPEGEARRSVSTDNSSNRLTPTSNDNIALNSDPRSIRTLTELHSLFGVSEFGTTQREMLRWSSASSVDFTDVSEQLDPESLLGFSSEVSKCGLCERLLSQRSPWSSRRIVRSGDMPITSVLSCRHVYHAECLEQTTPRTQKHDPPCPLCTKSVEENISEQRAISRFKNGRLKSFEDGSSRAWGCGQVGDCVEGALHAPPRNSMMLLSRSRIKKHLSMKGNLGKEKLPDKLKCGSYSFHGRKPVGHATVGCSRPTAEPVLKRS
eukprot:TRINITY_DN6927_c0_g5_i2.p1 TRINITY_DN6927_c0_g5~~TRINITY_DN6927_c0_g5_i2.p1  ORF type:complete len:439 (-),score=43.64 TRINITY_DN6927_c0_g5_i2:174-1490(-)